MIIPLLPYEAALFLVSLPLAVLTLLVVLMALLGEHFSVRLTGFGLSVVGGLTWYGVYTLATLLGP